MWANNIHYRAVRPEEAQLGCLYFCQCPLRHRVRLGNNCFMGQVGYKIQCHEESVDSEEHRYCKKILFQYKGQYSFHKTTCYMCLKGVQICDSGDCKLKIENGWYYRLSINNTVVDIANKRKAQHNIVVFSVREVLKLQSGCSFLVNLNARKVLCKRCCSGRIIRPVAFMPTIAEDSEGERLGDLGRELSDHVADNVAERTAVLGVAADDAVDRVLGNA